MPRPEYIRELLVLDTKYGRSTCCRAGARARYCARIVGTGPHALSPLAPHFETHRAERATGSDPPRGGGALMSRLSSVLRDPLLTVVMPVFNEASTNEDIITRVLAVPLRIQLIVVDDCSVDGTRDTLTRLQSAHGFTLLLQPRNQG